MGEQLGLAKIRIVGTLEDALDYGYHKDVGKIG